MLCLTELKGTDLDKSVDQVIKTKNALIDEFKNDSHNRKIHNDIIFKCYIRFYGSAPKKSNKSKVDDKLKENFGRNNWEITHKDEIGSFLRNNN